MMKKIIVSISLMIAVSNMHAQVLLVDSFKYTAGTLLGGNGAWLQNTVLSTGTTINANGLLFPGYSNGGSGAAEITTNGNPGDVVYRNIGSNITSGSVYASFLINITVAPTGTSNPYCITLGDQSGFAYAVRLLVKPSGAGLVKLGTRKAGGNDVWGTADYAINSTQLVVLRYSFVAGTLIDDVCKMYINPNITAAEPTIADADASAGADFTASIKDIVIRNNGGPNTPSALIDELHIATTFEDLFKKPVIQPSAINTFAPMQVVVLPNPSSQYITIQHLPSNASTIVIYDIDGKQLMQMAATKTIAITALAEGNYIVKIIDNNNIIVGISRFIKQ
jgi:hypothetical protein